MWAVYIYRCIDDFASNHNDIRALAWNSFDLARLRIVDREDEEMNNETAQQTVLSALALPNVLDGSHTIDVSDAGFQYRFFRDGAVMVLHVRNTDLAPEHCLWHHPSVLTDLGFLASCVVIKNFTADRLVWR